MPDIRSLKSQFDKTVQHDQKRLAIISAASDLLNRHGSRATTLQEIFRALNVTKTSLYLRGLRPRSAASGSIDEFANGQASRQVASG